ncbi:DUF5681 domain-containing protein [Sphingorhabdus sp. EL138]|uniref:DUF5681 domain-containing protein n=1 Tax=Sphingorhabdus sp. EL138 TaxID=2073156 RepID=UPI000D694506|nr:DUF5681 domain-containing protein [Sphingorhabdus sp. EL138]
MPKEYDVGYKKPPKHSQFQKGESGNPYGRPKKRKQEPVHDPSMILAEPVTVKSNGKTKNLSALEAGLRKKTQEALKTTSTRKLLKAIEMFDQAGLVKRPNDKKHHSVLRIPRRYDSQEFMERFQKEGPPPWDGPDDGLPMDESQTDPISKYGVSHD